MSDVVGQIGDLEFESSVVNSPMPVLVDFWAPWCGPCKMIAPVLEALAPAYDGKLKIIKINVDDNPQTAARYGVKSIPTLLMFSNGELVGTKVGLANKDELVKFIEQTAGC